MSEKAADRSQVPTFLVSPVMVKPPTCLLPPGTVIKSIPIQVGSFVLEPPNMLPAHTEPSACMNVFQDLKTFDMKVSTKGRRPKHTVSEVDRGCELGPGMRTDRPMCNSCGKYFMSRQQLNQHMLVHTDVRKYKCTYCERTFKQPSHLHQHHRIHTGEKPYKCPIPGCSRAFPQQSNLNHHLRNHDKPAPPPENTCSLCMRTYASETVLRSHISKIHMCNPEALLGLRIKTAASDFSKSPNDEKPAPVISARSIGNEMTVERNKVQQQFFSEGMTNHMFVVKQESVDHSIVQPSNIGSKLNTRNSVSEFKGDNSQLYIHENSRNTLMSEYISSKPVYMKSTACYIKTSDTGVDIPNRFVEAAAVERSFLDDVTDEKYKNEQTYASETPLTSGLNFPVSNGTISNNHMDGESSSDSVPLQIGRSRKRKAFQPHRIVKVQNVND